jgi:hypothetical protein
MIMRWGRKFPAFRAGRRQAYRVAQPRRRETKSSSSSYEERAAAQAA